MKNNRLIVAAAGSGKTTFLVEEALKIKDKNVLMTTFTEANEAEIRKKIIEKNKFIPGNITVQTWFSTLLQHGIRPYQGCLFDHDIKGMNLVSGRSAPYSKESDIKKHYFDRQYKIYSDKISKFLFKCNKASDGKILDRLSRIYHYLFIDEIQDLSGYDLDFLRLIFDSSINTLLVGDPRQATYSTSNSARNSQYARDKILDFFEDISNIGINDQLLRINYRSIPAICDLSNKLFYQHPQTQSGNKRSTDHDGVFLVRQKDVGCYLSQYKPMQLRDRRDVEVKDFAPVMNFGESKGLSFERVLIYPTTPIKEWLKDNSCDLAPTSRSKLYVAITRAEYSVAFVYDYKENEDIDGCVKHAP